MTDAPDDVEPVEPDAADSSDPWIPDPLPTDGPDPDIDHPEPTEPPAEPISYGMEDIEVTVDSGEAHTLGGWQGLGIEAPTVSCTNIDGTVVFDFDDPTGRPADVVVYTAGRP